MIHKTGRTKRIAAKLFLVVMGISFGLIVAELALRIVGYSYPEFYQLDQTRGYALRPGVEGWYRKEGEAYVRINSDGLRDREHSVTKPADTFRIAVLGDSYPEALSVSEDETFWSVMQGRLQECGAFAGKRVEVLNFGVSGYGTAQELLTLREQVWKYSPDLVMLTITTNNDITDNVRALKKTDQIPYFVYRDNQLTLDDSFKTVPSFVRRGAALNRFGRWLRDSSRVVQAAVAGHHAFKIQLASWQHSVKRPSTQSDQARPADNNQTTQQADQLSRSEELGTDNLVYLEPGNAVWNDAWHVTEGLIAVMRDEAKRRGAGFVVVTLSNGPQVLPQAKLREEFERRFGINDIFYPDKRIASFCAREGIPAITLAPEMQKTAEESGVFLHGFGADIGNGHWNSAGHRAAGELIAKKLCQETPPK